MIIHQDHYAGEKLFVDYAGQKVPIIDRTSGEFKEAEVFVAVMGASDYTFAEATWSQSLPDWIGSHVRAFSYLVSVPELVVPDNLRTWVQSRREFVKCKPIPYSNGPIFSGLMGNDVRKVIGTCVLVIILWLIESGAGLNPTTFCRHPGLFMMSNQS